MNRFYREGEYWTLAFNGEVARLRASRGLLLLSRLIGRPGRELHVLDLAEQRGGNADRVECTPGVQLGRPELQRVPATLTKCGIYKPRGQFVYLPGSSSPGTRRRRY